MRTPKRAQVRAARPGLKVPMEGAPHRYIEAEPVSITLTSYYRRQIKDGDLVIVEIKPEGKKP